MVLIIKEKSSETFHLARMAPFGYGPDKRLISILDENEDLDRKFIRVRLYRSVIDKLILQRRWHRNRTYGPDDVSNTLHDWIVEWFGKTNERTLFVEVSDDVFS